MNKAAHHHFELTFSDEQREIAPAFAHSFVFGSSLITEAVLRMQLADIRAQDAGLTGSCMGIVVSDYIPAWRYRMGARQIGLIRLPSPHAENLTLLPISGVPFNERR